MLSSRGSGLNQTWSFRLKNSLPASLTIRGNVTRPTHHQDARKTAFCQSVICTGSNVSPSEKMRATSLGWSFEDWRVMVLLRGPLPDIEGNNGSYAISEYD